MTLQGEIQDLEIVLPVEEVAEEFGLPDQRDEDQGQAGRRHLVAPDSGQQPGPVWLRILVPSRAVALPWAFIFVAITRIAAGLIHATCRAGRQSVLGHPLDFLRRLLGLTHGASIVGFSS